jgi:hypothetical protein
VCGARARWAAKPAGEAQRQLSGLCAAHGASVCVRRCPGPQALDRFRQQPQAVLVASDVAARGLDIPEVRAAVDGWLVGGWVVGAWVAVGMPARTHLTRLSPLMAQVAAVIHYQLPPSADTYIHR